MKTSLILLAFCFFHCSGIYSQTVEMRSIIETCATSMNQFWSDNSINRSISFTDSSRVIGFDKGFDKYILRDIDHEAIWTLQFTGDSRDSLYLTFDDNEGGLRHIFRLAGNDDCWTIVEHLMTIKTDIPDCQEAERFRELLESHESDKKTKKKKN